MSDLCGRGSLCILVFMCSAYRTYVALVQPDSDTATLLDRHGIVVDTGDGVSVEVVKLRFGCGRLLKRLRHSAKIKRTVGFLEP